MNPAGVCPIGLSEDDEKKFQMLLELRRWLLNLEDHPTTYFPRQRKSIDDVRTELDGVTRKLTDLNGGYLERQRAQALIEVMSVLEFVIKEFEKPRREQSTFFWAQQLRTLLVDMETIYKHCGVSVVFCRS